MSDVASPPTTKVPADKVRSFGQAKVWLKRDLVQRGALTPNGVVSMWMLLRDPVNMFIALLRLKEWTVNGRVVLPLRILIAIMFRRQAVRLGFSIPPNVFGPGLAIVHYGPIVVNGNARVGENCRVHTCVNIGGDGRLVDEELARRLAPCIGNNVYIGPGAKIYGGVQIADGIAIGANAVVNASSYKAGVTLAGIPAKVVSDKGSRGMIVGHD